MSDVEDGDIDDSPSIRPNCPECLQPMDPGHDDQYWVCPDGHLLLIDEFVHSDWWARATAAASRNDERPRPAASE